MSISTTCPGCKSLFRLPEELAGQPVRCQQCAQVFTVPLPASVAPPVVADAPIIADVLESPPQEEVAQPTSAARPRPAPPKVVPAPTVLGSLIAVVCFFCVIIGIGGGAASWVVFNLAPPRQAVRPVGDQRDKNRVFDKDKVKDWPVKVEKDIWFDKDKGVPFDNGKVDQPNPLRPRDVIKGAVPAPDKNPPPAGKDKDS